MEIIIAVGPFDCTECPADKIVGNQETLDRHIDLFSYNTSKILFMTAVISIVSGFKQISNESVR